MVNGKPVFISLFAGCGGSSLGYRWAGFRELLAIDFDKIVIETFRLNFPDIPCWQKDIRETTGKEIMEFCGMAKGKLDLLDASPPCQGFSTCGRRKIRDERNDLFKEFIRLVRELKPKVFVMENVSGLLVGKMKGMFIEIMKGLKSLPYRVECKLMNAMYYRVPQSRRRLIWIGVREDLGKRPYYPKPEIANLKSMDYLDDDLPDDETILSDYHLDLWKRIGERGGDINNRNRNQSGFSFKRIRPRKSSYTITKIPKTLSHYEIPRYLNIKELKRLSSFSDDFEFIGNYRQRWGMIGNAVMPRFMEAIARIIKERILDDAPIS